MTVGTGEPGRYPSATPVGTGTGVNRWLLVEDPLPPMENSEIPIGSVVRVEGAQGIAGLPATIPAHSEVKILFDGGAMTTAHPELTVSRGRGARLRVTYAEALVDAKGKKGNRNEVANRSILGLTDTLSPDGGTGRAWTPLSWRAWRYLQVDVRTGDEALSLDSLSARYTGYPFRERASLEASDPSIARIWKVGTRTARMNAHETYMDCPYWEQLQYIGDTRHPGAHLLRRVWRRPARPTGARRLRSFKDRRGPDPEPLPERPQPGDPHLLAPVDRDAPRLLALPAG